MKEYLIKLINNFDKLNPYAEHISNWILFLLLILFSYLSYIIIKPIILRIVTKLTLKSKTHWDDVLLQERFFHKIALLIPIFIIHFFIPFFTHVNTKMHELVLNILEIILIIIVIQIVLSFLNGANKIFDSTEKGKRKSIKGYIQVIKLIIYFLGAISIFSTLSGQNALTLITGLGAFAAILLLVFQDAIKGLASGVQLSANDMVRKGDWISVPKFGADGNVIDISLTTVKVQNWDKTISMIPSYALVSDSFSNWRGMEESGGRRIKRSIFIDLNSIHFLNNNEIEDLSKIDLISDYIQNKQDEINKYNQSITNISKNEINGRKLTNIGTFRKYLEAYIKTNQDINTNMTFMVRQLQSSEKGLPIEIYAFSKVQSWVEYEEIQSNVFDHIFAVLNTFNLTLFQNPSGQDFREIKK